MNIITWAQDHWTDIVEAYAMLVAFVSAVLLLVPVLPEGHWALPIVKFLGKFVALNKNIGKRPKN